MRRKAYSFAMRGLMALSVAITCGFALFIIVYVLCKGLPNITWQLLSTGPSILNDRIGILPDILNTLYLILAALAVVLPLGVGAAVYLTEYAASKRLVSVIEYAAETLSGIPSIIYGFVGMMLFAGTFGTSLLAGALTLVIMNLPTVMRTAQESLKTVPRSYREGALGLGSGQWRMIRTVVLPSAVDGITAGCILAAGRVVGESAVLMYTAGLSMVMQDFSTIEGLMKASGSTLTVALYVYAKERADFAAAFAVAAVLLALAVLLNFAAGAASGKLQKK